MHNKVLIVTGGLINAKESSLFSVLKKEILHTKSVKSAWLEYKIKAVAAEPILTGQIARKKNKTLKDYFSYQQSLDPPELTEVVLMGLLRDEGLDFEAITYHEVFADKEKTERMLTECNTVFMSSTLLHDLSEMMPLVKMMKRPHNRIVVGGALAGSICHYWEGEEEVAILAIGYGEMMMHALANWIKSGFTILLPPERGRIIPKKGTQFLFSGVPETKNLDFLPRPDWQLAAEYHKTSYDTIYYESVRGCPYRCSFCNYPYLFDDQKFRKKSAEKMADDWGYYVREMGVKYITCLDSLFTIPQKRLVEFCNLLIERDIQVKWICYARADDLADEAITALMKKAGVHQVQIGIESGNQQQLDNMNKRCSVDSNYKALENCRKHGITTIVSFVIGFPGETRASLEETLQFIKIAQPDFYFLATFSTRVDGVPVLNSVNRTRFGLRTMDNPFTFAPYWTHFTMCCSDVGNHVRWLNREIMVSKSSLEGALFWGGILHYQPEDRGALLDHQYRLATQYPIVTKLFNKVNRWIDKRLKKDVARNFKGILPQTISDKSGQKDSGFSFVEI